MPTQNESAINNSFQIVEDFKAVKVKRSFYKPSKKSRFSSRAQPPGSVKTLSEEEVFLYKVRKHKQILQEEEGL